MEKLGDMSGLASKAIELGMVFVPKIFFALLVLWIGFKIATKISNMVTKMLNARPEMDASLNSFLTSIVSMGLKVLVVLTAAGMVGIEVTSFIALLGAASLAIGVSLQGALSNFAGGVMLLLFRPFRVGDMINAQGEQGVVKEINIVSTVLTTLDNRRVILPNGTLANDKIINYSAEGLIRVDLAFGIAYEDNIDEAKKVIAQKIEETEKTLSDPAPTIAVESLGESSVNIACRAWCKPEHYWDVYFELTENIKKAFDENGISIPYPQRVVHTVAG